MISTFRSNFRIATRILWREPSFSLAVILTLALAIGASTAVFSFANTLLLRPFPFAEPERLFEIRSLTGGEPGKISMPEVLDIKALPSIESIAAHTGSAGGYNFSGAGHPEEWKAILCTGNLFEVLGIGLTAGTPWPADMDRNRGYRVVLSYGVWQSSFAGRPDVLGTTITLDHAPGYVVHGVAPKGFDFPRGVQVFRSLGGFTNYEKRDSRNLVAVARLRPGATATQLRSELASLSQDLERRFPNQNRGLALRADSFEEIYTAQSRPFLFVLLAAVGLVLAMACLNAANLLVVRALGLRQDLTVRLALGAGRREVALRFLSEGLLLALLSCSVGLLLANWWMKLLHALVADRLPAWMTVTIDGRVLAFALGIAVLASLAASLAPIFSSMSESDLASQIRMGGRGMIGNRGSQLLRNSLVGSQVALAVVLLAGAALLIRGFVDLQKQDKGFSAQDISSFRVALGWKRYITQDLIAGYHERAQRELASVPGFSAVAFAHAPPLTGQELDQNNTILASGQTPDDAQRNPLVQLQSISENYFETLRIPMVAGRKFTSFDGKDSAPVAIVSQRLAQRLFPSESAVGKKVALNATGAADPKFREIVGVVGNTQREALGSVDSQDVYLPFRQSAHSNQYFLIRTTLPLAEFQRRVEQTLWAIDSQQSLFDVRSYPDRLLDGIWQLRLSQYLLTIFGGVALALAAIGVYGLMSYLVAMQRQEFGVRLALGAQPSWIRSLVLHRSGRIVIVGIAAGLVATALLSQILKSQIPQIRGLDLLAYSVAGALVAAASLLASSIPAWRASRVDPLVALQGK
jgi:putative ABC transport system permease protein